MKKLFAVLAVLAMVFCFTVPAMADSATATSSIDIAGGHSFLGSGYKSGVVGEANAGAGSLLGRHSEANATVSGVAGLGDIDFHYHHGTVVTKSEGMAMGMGHADAETCGLLSAAYADVKITAWQENWTNAFNFNFEGEYGQAGGGNYSEVTSKSSDLDLGIFGADASACDFALTHGETVAFVNVGHNTTTAGAFTKNSGIGDCTYGEGSVYQQAVAQGHSGYAATSGEASFAGSSGQACTIGTATVQNGVVSATSSSHASTGSGYRGIN